MDDELRNRLLAGLELAHERFQRREAMAWLTGDHSVAMRCPGGITPVTKSRNPTVVEYDCMMGHPQAVALVADLQSERASA